MVVRQTSHLNCGVGTTCVYYLVEDDPTTSKSIEMMLTHANLNVYATDLGEEGIDLAKLYDYDLILLDLEPA